jgi:hypothetical protein
MKPKTQIIASLLMVAICGAAIGFLIRTWLGYLLLYCFRGHFDSLVDAFDRTTAIPSSWSVALICASGGLVATLCWVGLNAKGIGARCLLLFVILTGVIALSTYHFRLISIPFGFAAAAFSLSQLKEKRNTLSLSLLLAAFVALSFSPVDLSFMKLTDPAGFQTMDYLANGRGPFAPYVWAW